MADADSTPFSKCAHCASDFSQRPGAKKTIYCSKSCQIDHNLAYRANKAISKKYCAHCGKGFIGKGKKVFCSGSCSVDHYSAYAQNEGRDKGAHAVLQKPCKVCGKEFSGKSTQVYCSKQCRDSEAKRLSKKRERVYAPYIGMRNCKSCDSEFKAYKGRREKYCSKECRDSSGDGAKALNEAKREKYLAKMTGETCPVVYRKCAHCQTTYTDRPVYHNNLFCSPDCSAAYREKYKVFYYRWDRGFELTGLRICPESGYLFKPTSTKQVYFSREYTKAACSRKNVSLRRARMREVDCDSIDPFDVFDAAGWHCEHCGKETPKDKRGTKDHNAPELDHIIPLSKGGSHTLDNVQLLCWQCNSEKSDKLPDEWLAKDSSIPLEAT